MALTLRPAERILGAYAVFVIVVAATRWTTYPRLGWVLAAHLLVLVLVALLARGNPRHLLRAVAPVVALLALYGSLDLLGGSGAASTHDALVRSWEVGIFGWEPARDWWQRQPSTAASFVLHAAYLSYFVIVPAPVLYFALRRQAKALDRTLTALLLAFVTCYVCFILAPVAGPYYEYPRPAAWFVANLPARAVYAILSGGSSFGAAFPSSHVAATWAAVGAAWYGSRRLGSALAPAAALLTVSVVYCQMHYAVDAAAGLAVGAAAVLGAAALHRR